MSVSIHWDNPEQTALILTFTAPWSWNEYEIISDEIQAQFEAVSHPVDLIIDLRQAGHVPDTVLAQFRDAYADGETNLGQYIFVGATVEFIEQLATIDRYLTAMGGVLDYRCVNTLAEAQRISYWKYLTRQYNGIQVTT